MTLLMIADDGMTLLMIVDVEMTLLMIGVMFSVTMRV